MGRLLRRSGALPDLILVFGLYGFSAVLYWQASLLPPPFFDPLGSAAVPKFAAVVLAVLATFVLWRVVRRHGADPEPVDEATSEDEAPARPAPLVALGATLLPTIYVGLMATGLLGFREATVLFVFAMGSLLARFRKMAVLVLIPAALVIGVGFDFIFTEVFFVDLPKTFAP